MGRRQGFRCAEGLGRTVEAGAHSSWYPANSSISFICLFKQSTCFFIFSALQAWLKPASADTATNHSFCCSYLPHLLSAPNSFSNAVHTPIDLCFPPYLNLPPGQQSQVLQWLREASCRKHVQLIKGSCRAFGRLKWSCITHFNSSASCLLRTFNFIVF